MKKFLIILILFFPLLVSADNEYTIDFESDNDQSLSITDGSQTGLDLSGDFTFEAWINVETETQMMILAKYRGSNNQRAYNFQWGSTADRLQITISDDLTSAESYVATADSNISAGTWYHVAVTFDASESEAKFYTDGSQTGNAVTGTMTSIANSSEPFEIGVLNSTVVPFDGKVDTLRVWSDVRTVQELNNNKDSCNVPDSNLISEWWFENDLLDETANNNDLTNNNSATFQSATVPFLCPGQGAGVGDTSIDSHSLHYSKDLTIVSGHSHLYVDDATTTPYAFETIRVHIPFLGWLVIYLIVMFIAIRIILEIIIRWRV